MFHAVARVAIIREVNQKSVRVEFRRSPHRRFSAHDLLDVAHQCRTLTTFATQRMNDDVISLAVDSEPVICPVKRNFSWRIDQHIPIRKLKLRLVLLFRSSVYDAPAFRRTDRKRHRILFMIHDVHEHTAAVKVCVARIELGKSS